eukprot:1159932-Pelagomonas_calceolata.AAC.4
MVRSLPNTTYVRPSPGSRSKQRRRPSSVQYVSVRVEVLDTKDRAWNEMLAHSSRPQKQTFQIQTAAQAILCARCVSVKRSAGHEGPGTQNEMLAQSSRPKYIYM